MLINFWIFLKNMIIIYMFIIYPINTYNLFSISKNKNIRRSIQRPKAI